MRPNPPPGYLPARMDTGELEERLRDLGATAEGIRSLDGPARPDLVSYLDLVGPAQRGRGKLLPHAVVEVERRPVLYAVKGPISPDARKDLQHLLAQRSQADYLAVVEPGHVSVVAVRLSTSKSHSTEQRLSLGTAAAASLVPRLAYGIDAPPSNGRAFHDALLDLLDRTIQKVTSAGVPPADALSWVGRAMFFRFLQDRGIIEPSALPAGPKDAFSSSKHAARTNRWLDATFNGDLLPLRDRGTGRAWPDDVWNELTKMVLGADERGQLAFDWHMLDFGHIPVGLLSQVYEAHCHRYEPESARAQSVHYTPRGIAEYMVDEALSGIERPHEATILDPAAGAGVFLVAGLRALVRERWRNAGRRPSRAEIRRVLNRQVHGFDLQETALRLAALSLYLTALELDPSPAPLEALKFEGLRGRALFEVQPPLGSLAELGDDHAGRYDVVIGNPPWTSWVRPTGKEARAFEDQIGEVEGRTRKTVEDRLGADAASEYTLTDNVPDLPFVWGATRWARPGGRIALALHARWLFKQSPSGIRDRNLLLRGLRVTGILNGAALRATKVWPGNQAPFSLLFATNEVGNLDNELILVSPEADDRLSSRGNVRIDATMARPVSVRTLITTPTTPKTYYRGTALDAHILAKVTSRGYPPFAKYWNALGLVAGQGYQRGGAGSGGDASHLRGLPAVEIGDAARLVLRRYELSRTMTADRLRRAYERARYRAPLVLIRHAPSVDPWTPRVHLAGFDVAYNESFYGLSTYGHPHANALAQYLLLLFGSRLFEYHALLTSAQFGVEREKFHVDDFKAFPVRPFEDLTSGERKSVERIANAWTTRPRTAPQADELVFDLYGISAKEARTIDETLAVGLPYASARQRGQRPPTAEEIQAYADALTTRLNAFLGRRNQAVAVKVHQSVPPWNLLTLSPCRAPRASPPPTEVGVTGALPAQVMYEAEAMGASVVSYVMPGTGGVMLAIFAQYRYWLPSRVALLVNDLLCRYEEVLVENVTPPRSA